MKVVMVAPYPPQTDGIGVHAHNVVEALTGLASMSVLTRRLPSADFPATLSTLRLLSASPTSLYRTVRALKRLEPDVIHYQFNIPALGMSWVWAILGGIIERRRRGARLVFTLHEVRRDIDLIGPLGAQLFRWIGHHADSLVVYTAEAHDLLTTRCDIPTQKISVMPHGAPDSFLPLSEDRRRQVVDRYGANDSVLYLGYIHPDKGIEHLVAAVALIKESSPASLAGVTVLIAGSVRSRKGVFRLFERKDHRYEEELRQSVQRLNLQDVINFVGFVPQEDLAPLLVSARLAVLPYVNATQSGVLNLLLAARTPTVASRLPGLEETLGDAALFVPPGDPRALASEICRLLDDDDLRLSLTTKMAKVHSDVLLTLVAARLVELYREGSTNSV